MSPPSLEVFKQTVYPSSIEMGQRGSESWWEVGRGALSGICNLDPLS